MTDLTAVDGVGPSTASELNDLGIDTAEELAESDVDDLSDLSLVGGSTPTDLIENAVNEVGSSTSIAIELDDHNFNHLFAAVTDEAIERQMGISARSPAACHDVLADLRSVGPSIIDDRREFEFEWNDEQLDAINAAIKRRYRNNRRPPYLERIGHVVEQIEAIREERQSNA